MRSNLEIRQKAETHFNQCIEHAQRMQRDVHIAERDKELGLRLLDAALALAPETVLDLEGLLPADVSQQEGYGQALRVLPYIGSSLRLLELEFAHKDLGTLPFDVVGALLKSGGPHEHEGVMLTRATVFVQWRKRPAG